jgi:transmembrane protein TMEM174 (potassium channel)
MTKGRVEAFSDGVFAVIITIMVLKLKLRWDRADPICHGRSGPSTTGPAAQQHQHPKRLIVELDSHPSFA